MRRLGGSLRGWRGRGVVPGLILVLLARSLGGQSPPPEQLYESGALRAAAEGLPAGPSSSLASPRTGTISVPPTTGSARPVTRPRPGSGPGGSSPASPPSGVHFGSPPHRTQPRRGGPGLLQSPPKSCCSWEPSGGCWAGWPGCCGPGNGTAGQSCWRSRPRPPRPASACVPGTGGRSASCSIRPRLRLSPHGRAPALGPLDAGGAVQILRNDRGWVLVRVAGSREGWVAADAIAAIGG